MTPETLTVDLQEGKLSIEVLRAGQGHPLLYLHGAVGQKGWAPFLEQLSQHFTVYAPYLPGYSRSTGLEHLDDLLDLTLCHLELMDILGLSSAHLMGHFLGGMVAAEIAAIAPGYVNHMALIAPAGLWRDDAPVVDFLSMNSAELQARLWSNNAGNVAISPADLAAAEQAQALLSPDRMQDLTVAGKFLWPIPDKGLKRRAYRIKAPTLVIWGQEDRIISAVYAQDFANMIRNSQLVTLPGTGHMLMLEQSETFTRTVTRFLKE